MVNSAAYFSFDSILAATSMAAVIFLTYLLIQLKKRRKVLKRLQEDLQSKDREIADLNNKLDAAEQEFFENERISFLSHTSAGILHQISQPITAIYGFVKFMKKEIKPGDQFYTPVLLMEEQSQHLKKMLDDLMELIQKRPLVKENVNVNEIIEKSMRLVSDELKIRRIQPALQLKENLPMVYVDRVSLQHIFMNLIINAMEALSTSRAGYVRIFQITSSFNETTQEIEIFFKDSGPGIEDKDRERIFEPFFSTKKNGCGMGLALCRELAAGLKGTLSFENGRGGITSFVVRLPSAGSLKASFSAVEYRSQ